MEGRNIYFNNKVALIEPSGGYSGMQYYNFGMATGLINNGVIPFLFTSNSKKLNIGANVNTFYFFDNVWSSKYNLLKFFYLLTGFFKSIYISKKNACKIVHLHQFHLNFNLLVNVFICKLFFRRLVLTVHDVESFGGNNRFHKVYTYLMPRLVDEFIVHNKYSLSQFKLSINTNAVIIKHGNYIPFFNKLLFRPFSEKFRLLFFGLIKDSKGLDVLLESLVYLKDLGLNFELIIAGRPWRNDFERYKSFIDANDLNNYIKTHLYFISEEELLNHYSNCDLVVLPYKKIFQSGVLLKSMSLNRAVLCSNLPGFEELVLDGFNGFIFESENSNSMALKLAQIIRDRNRLPDIATNAYELLAKEYDWDIIGFELIELYNNIYDKNS